MQDEPNVLNYSGRSVDARGRNPVGGLALFLAIVGTPLLRIIVRPRPFWDGHPLHWIRAIVEAIPVLALPLPGILVGLAAFAYARAATPRRRTELAWAAILVSLGWYLLLAAVFIFIAMTWRGGMD
jgi:hypothetical protein